MAEKRMFAKTIVLSDAFLDMPMSARCLYFTLNMFADDDGFVGSPKGIMRQCGASQDDMRILIAKKFVLDFDSGVIVIKHWRINNYLRGDRHKSTTYQDEMGQIAVDEKGAYTRVGIPSDNQVATIGIPSIDKNREDKNRKDKSSIPTLDEVRAYCTERNNKIDPERFIDYYSSQGWKKNNGQKVVDWKACVRQWEKREKQGHGFQERSYDYSDLEDRLINK